MFDQPISIPSPAAPSGDRYFQALREGWALVRFARRRCQIARNAPSYIAGAWDSRQDCWEPVENIGPHDKASAALDAAWAHPIAARILRAWGMSPSDPFYASYEELLDRMPRR